MLTEFQKTILRNLSGVVAYYRMEGNSNDEIGGNNGSDTNIQYGTAYGVFGQGWARNGAQGSNWTTIPHIAGLNGVISISVRVLFSSIREQGIISKGLTGGTLQWGFKMGSAGASNRVSFFMDTDGSWGPTVEVSDPTTPSSGVYYTYTAVYNGSNIKVYRDGKLVATASHSTGSINQNGSIYLGNFYDTSSGYGLDGYLDDVVIFNRELSAYEVYQIAKGHSLGEYIPNANTKFYYPFNGNSADASGATAGGTDTAVTYSLANGKLGQGAGFLLASASRVSIPQFITSGNNMTFRCLFKLDNLPTGLNWANIFTLNNDTYFIQVGVDASGYVKQINKDTVGDNIITSSIQISTGVWYHLVCVWNFGGTCYTYINGRQVASTSVGSHADLGGQFGRYIGASRNGTNENWDGAIDDACFENIAWTASKIQKDYAQVKGRLSGQIV
jgi:hypothetical protein